MLSCRTGGCQTWLWKMRRFLETSTKNFKFVESEVRKFGLAKILSTFDLFARSFKARDRRLKPNYHKRTVGSKISRKT